MLVLPADVQVSCLIYCMYQCYAVGAVEVELIYR